MNLFVNTYVDPDPKRTAEIAGCLETNRRSGLFTNIIDLPGRATFDDMFEAMADYPHDVNVIANADIYFNGTIRKAWNIERHQCYALTRWEEAIRGRNRHYGHSDSQDAWIFLGSPGIRAPFALGIPDCDGRLAWLLRNAGYMVTNPSLSIEAIHVHHSQVRWYVRGGHGPGRGAPKLHRLGPPTIHVPIRSL